MSHARRSQAEAAESAASTRILAQRLDAYGPLLLALYFLATTRWGSYVAPGPPYVGDVAILVLLANRALLVASGRSGRPGRDVTIALLGSALITWSVIRLAFGELSVDAARDVAPYLYVVVAFLVVPLGAREEGLVRRLITVALIFHVAWLTVTVLFGRLPLAPTIPWAPGGEMFVFGIRGDASTFACGLLAALSLHRALVGRAPSLNLLLVAWPLAVAIGGLDARASLIAVMLQLAIVVALAPMRSRQRIPAATGGAPFPRPGDPRVAIVLLVVAAPLALYAAREGPVVRTIPHGLNPDAARPFERPGPAATARARLRSWDRLVGWVTDDPARIAVGVGMGPNYYRDSGALRLLEAPAREEVRAPHNYWLNTWARLGVPGLLLAAAIWLASLRLAALVARGSDQLRDSDLLAMLVAATLPIAATFGVLLESPFGAIPYFWAVGHLSVRACELGAASRLSAALRPSSQPA